MPAQLVGNHPPTTIQHNTLTQLIHTRAATTKKEKQVHNNITHMDRAHIHPLSLSLLLTVTLRSDTKLFGAHICLFICKNIPQCVSPAVCVYVCVVVHVQPSIFPLHFVCILILRFFFKQQFEAAVASVALWGYTCLACSSAVAAALPVLSTDRITSWICPTPSHMSEGAQI